MSQIAHNMNLSELNDFEREPPLNVILLLQRCAEFPKVLLLTLLKVIYYFVQYDSQRRILQILNLNASLASQICRRLQDVCSLDLQTRLIIPFGGPGAVVKCDESKFNHKAKVNVIQK